MATQEGISDGLVNYYDIMILGIAGMGKSTTADKLLIANPTSQNYLDHQASDCYLDEKEGRVKADDISMWILSEKQQQEEERVRTRVKNLVFFRSLSDSLKEVNDARESEMNAFAATTEFELLSNDTTKIRILDVPGFFHQGKPSLKVESPGATACEIESSNLDMMRKILHLQTALVMKFRRLLYFLPMRGAIGRENPILISELKWITHFFGRSIFDSMVLVSTVSTHISLRDDIKDEDKYPQSVLDRSQTIFHEAMQELFPQVSGEPPLETPPIIFISMTDSCKRVLQKVQDAKVHNDKGLKLKVDRNTCVDCGMKTKLVHGEGVACYFSNEREQIPYYDSKCHPLLVPKLSSKIRNGFLAIFGRRAILKGEVCIACKRGPNSPGCMKIGSVQTRRLKRNIVVDHNNEMTDEKIMESLVLSREYSQARCDSPVVGIPSPSLVRHDNGEASYTIFHYKEPSRQPVETEGGFYEEQ